MLPLASSRRLTALRGHLLLYLCCLITLLSAISACAQSPAAQLQWTQANFTGLVAYSPTQPLIAAVRDSVKSPCSTPMARWCRRFTPARSMFIPSPSRRMGRRWPPAVS